MEKIVPKVCYGEFIEFKNEYLRDPYPFLTFGQAFCTKFNIDDPRISGALSVASARVRIEEAVEWVI